MEWKDETTYHSINTYINLGIKFGSSWRSSGVAHELYIRLTNLKYRLL